MIEEVLPAGVSSAEAFADPPRAALFPEELVIVENAADKRRREFTTGRSCARSALRRLGVAPGPILTGERGAPAWPAGIAGSITHCAGYRAAAVARVSDFVTLGLDAEPDSDLPDGVLDRISLAAERARLRRLSEAVPGISWDRLLFSAKESVYKAWFPLTRRWLGFNEADITMNAMDGTFSARLLTSGPLVGGLPLSGFTGRWLARGGLLMTAIALPAPGASRPG